MTLDWADPSPSFTWDDSARRRVTRRAQEIRRKRRTLATVLAGVILAVAVGTAILSVSASSNVRVATTAPDPTVELATLLPTPRSVEALLQGLHVKLVTGGRDFGVLTPAELVGAQRATFGVERQWVNGTGSVQLQPGQPFPDEVVSVVSAVIRFQAPADAEAWFRQAVARPGSALLQVVVPPNPNGEPGPVHDNLAVLREPGELPGQAQYLAVFTIGDTASSLAMVAGGSGHDGEFVTLVQELWLHRR